MYSTSVYIHCSLSTVDNQYGASIYIIAVNYGQSQMRLSYVNIESEQLHDDDWTECNSDFNFYSYFGGGGG